MQAKVGDRVVVTPDPAFFTDPADYRYVMREDSSANGKTLTVAAVFDPSPARSDLPRSGVPTYKLVDEHGIACYLAVESEMSAA